VSKICRSNFKRLPAENGKQLWGYFFGAPCTTEPTKALSRETIQSMGYICVGDSMCLSLFYFTRWANKDVDRCMLAVLPSVAQ